MQREDREPLLRAVEMDDMSQVEKQKKLMTFPRGQRALGYLAKIGWGLLLGAGTIVGIIALVPTAHFLIIGVLVTGAVLYAVKTAKEIHAKHQEERKAIENLEKAITKSVEQFKEEMRKFHEIEELCQEAHLRELQDNEKEELYAYIWQLQQRLKEIKIARAAQNNDNWQLDDVVGIEDRINTARLSVFRSLNHATPERQAFGNSVRNDSHHPLQKLARTTRGSLDIVINEAPLPAYMPEKIKRKKDPGWFSSPGTFFSKLGNRALEFTGGFCAGLAVGVAVLSFAVGAVAAGALLSNPVGWAFLGVIAGAAIVGALAVGVSYLVNRSQQEKINKLTHETNQITHRQTGLIGQRTKVDLINAKRHGRSHERTAIAAQADADRRKEEKEQAEALARRKEEEKAAAEQRAQEESVERQRAQEEARRLAEDKRQLAEKDESSTKRIEELLHGHDKVVKELQGSQQAAKQLELEKERLEAEKIQAQREAEQARIKALEIAAEERVKAERELEELRLQKEKELSELREQVRLREAQLAELQSGAQPSNALEKPPQ